MSHEWISQLIDDFNSLILLTFINSTIMPTCILQLVIDNDIDKQKLKASSLPSTLTSVLVFN